MKLNKKIAFVMPWHISERGGGAEVQANYLAMELTKRGFIVFYICQTSNPNKSYGFDMVGNVNVYWLKPSGRFPWLDQNKYYKPLKTIKPDIVIQRMSSNVNYIVGKYCKKSNASYSWICTDNLNPYKNFHVKKFKERFSTKNISLLKYVIFLMNAKLMDYYRKVGMRYVDYGFAQNNIQKKLLKQNFNIETYTMVSGHPIPKKQIKAEDRFKFKTVLWCANFGKHKRPELFIELARRMQHTKLKFVMVGGHSDKDYMNAILKNKPSNLCLTGQLPFEKALGFFNEATVLVNTSISEGFSNTYIQAWLRGLPTLVFGADPDAIIKQNKLGFNVESIEEGIEKLQWILSDYSVYKTLSDNAYKYACKNHSIKRMTDNFLKIMDNEDITLS